MKLDIFTKLERGPANILRSVDGGWRLIIAASNLQQSRQLWYATMGENPTITTVGGKRRLLPSDRSYTRVGCATGR